MSTYTTQLRYVIEQTLSDNGIDYKKLTVSERCEKVSPFIFNFNYPFTDKPNVSRETFQKNFLRHFYMSEIGAETVGLWKLFLEDWLNVNMPYYNQLMELTYKEFDFDNYDYTETFDGIVKNDEDTMSHTVGEDNRTVKKDEITNESSSTEQSGDESGESHSMEKYYETPSSNISSITDHLNNAREIAGNSSSNSSATGSGTRDMTVKENMGDDLNTERTVTGNKDEEIKTDNLITKKGRQGVTIAQILKDYMEVVDNIMNTIYNEMEILFMQIY